MTSSMRLPARGLFVATILTGSFLLFLVQPMVARMALPRLGGAPAVWNSAMLVYQALLLGGYAYAHWLTRVSLRMQAVIHIGVLLIAALWLPIGLIAMAIPTGGSPVLWVPWLLLVSIGPLFFAVSAQAPLIQRWFGAASGGRDPYALYAASNLGSFAGLIAYPLLVEPTMALHGQSWLWSGGYVALVVLVLGCATMLPRGRGTAQIAADMGTNQVVANDPPPTRARIARWIVLALVPSGLMLATTTYITTDIVAMPLLWVLPLGLYLLSFTVAFATDRSIADLLTRIAPITILVFGGIIMGGYQERPYMSAGIALVLLFMVAVALHTALYRMRPAAERLTGFYLAMAAGGALGGVFAGLLAPVIFDWTYEYPLLILAAGILVPQMYLTGSLRGVWLGTHRRTALLFVVIAMAVLFTLRFSGPPRYFGEDAYGFTFIVLAIVGLAAVGARLPYTLVLASALVLFGGYRSIMLSAKGDARTRSYFGIYTVRTEDGTRELDHGTTMHGVQLLGSAARQRTPTTYYAAGSGVGRAMAALPELYGPHARVGVVGLGTGTLACYARAGQDWRFYEIDPAIVHIARDTGQFTFLSQCLPHPAIHIGDARLSLEREPAVSLDLLALDAFSSDAVPMHLMTRAAFATYRRVIGPHGLLLVHISNRFIDLEPVVEAVAKADGWHTAQLSYQASALDRADHASDSIWIALSPDPRPLTVLQANDPTWSPVASRAGMAPWTDDYSSILPLLKNVD